MCSEIGIRAKMRRVRDPERESEGEPFRLRSLSRGVYAPSLVYALGRGMMIPAVPLFAEDLGSALGLIGLVVATRSIGATVFDIPAGLLTTRIGARNAMALGSAGVAAAALATAFAGSAQYLLLTMPLLGASETTFQISRLALVSGAVPVSHRGRAISLIGGTSRIGTFLGPIAGGFAGLQYGVEVAFFGQAALALVALLLIVSEHQSGLEIAPVDSGERAHRRIARIVSEHHRVLIAAGSVALSLRLVREARQILIPLWGSALGLDLAQIGLIFGLSAAVDMTLFWPVGFVMDRWGRKWTIVPSLLTLAATLALVPLTTNFATFLAVGLLSGLGNGLGSGAVQVMGADLAPRERTGEFLGVWRAISDSGAIVAPLGVGALAQALTLGAAFVAPAVVGVAGAALLLFVVPETRRRDREPET